MRPRFDCWKQKLIGEMVEYYFNFVDLAFLLVAFAWYRRLILAEYDILYLGYWVPLVEAAVLAKVIMVGDLMPLWPGLERKPLLLPTLFRTVLFSIWVGLFSVLERTARALFNGKGLTAGFADW